MEQTLSPSHISRIEASSKICVKGMSKLVLEISEDLAEALRVPPDERLSRVRQELALRLYQKGLLSFGKARELAQMSKWAFHELLGSEGVVRSYDARRIRSRSSNFGVSRLKAVSNSSVLIALSRIGQLSLLNQRFPDGVLLPEAVWHEVVRSGAGQPGAEEVASATWFTVSKVANQSLVSLLQIELDAGEAEAIALFLEEPVDAILLDEKNIDLDMFGIQSALVVRTGALSLSLKCISLLDIVSSVALQFTEDSQK